jgi:hypothetical protein
MPGCMPADIFSFLNRSLTQFAHTNSTDQDQVRGAVVLAAICYFMKHEFGLARNWPGVVVLGALSVCFWPPKFVKSMDVGLGLEKLRSLLPPSV